MAQSSLRGQHDGDLLADLLLFLSDKPSGDGTLNPPLPALSSLLEEAMWAKYVSKEHVDGGGGKATKKPGFAGVTGFLGYLREGLTPAQCYTLSLRSPSLS
ncbi:MAG: hypothetical protein AB4352_16880 [Hormoscilla sp.]